MILVFSSEIYFPIIIQIVIRIYMVEIIKKNHKNKNLYLISIFMINLKYSTFNSKKGRESGESYDSTSEDDVFNYQRKM